MLREVASIHDQRFDLPEVLPFEPGRSPFRGRGALYIGLTDFVEAKVSGGKAAVVKALPQPNLASFFEQRFRLDSWYDLIPIAYVSKTLARLRGVGFTQHLRDTNRWAVYEKAGYIYSALMSVASAPALARAIPRASSLVHDFGTTRTNVIGKTRVSVERSGVPQALVRWLATSGSAFLEYTLERSGATIGVTEFAEPVQDGERMGHPTYTLSFEVRWV